MICKQVGVWGWTPSLVLETPKPDFCHTVNCKLLIIKFLHKIHTFVCKKFNIKLFFYSPKLTMIDR